ncbi:MAG TPA: aminotransferase class I/II-fold pyridoxal phosphate-dependent enzyme [Cyclobacteriaceae bacterium]|nr:aminotransferase class I/II-fold pyridoxal phosphate-dependent enzyme [Cyclobacteriaceae bacterium]
MIAFAKRIQNVEEYYFSKKLAEVRKLDTPELPVINLGIGSPDQMPSANSINALVESAKKPGSHGYQNYKGVPALRQAIAAFSERTYGTRLDTETMILPLMGSKEGIMHIMMAFVDEGDEVLIPDPGYPTYGSVAKLVGAKVNTYSMPVNVNELRSKDLSKVKIMWVNYPHMPTGTTASKEELKQLVDLAREKKFIIVNDNPYSLILNNDPQSILAAPNAFEVALELNSLSKSHNMAGWRIGWVAGRADYIDAVLRVKSNMDSGMFLGLQQAAIEALNADKTWFESVNKVYAERKVVAEQILDLLGCSYSKEQSGLFVWAKAPSSVSDIEKWIDEILYSTKVFITPGFIFGPAGGRHIRISLCAPVEKLKEAHARLKPFIK